MTSKQKPQLDDVQRAILNSAYDKLAVDPDDGWFAFDTTPPMTKAWKDGLLNHRENTKEYRISGKGLWMLGKEHPLKAKRNEPRNEVEQAQADLAGAAAKDLLTGIESVWVNQSEGRMILYKPDERIGRRLRNNLLDYRTIHAAVQTWPIKPSEEGSVWYVRPDDDMPPEDDTLTVASVENELALAHEERDGERHVYEAEIRRLQEQIAEMTVAWAQDENAAKARIAELEARENQWIEAATKDAEKMVALAKERDAAKAEADRLANARALFAALVETLGPVTEVNPA